MSKNRHDMLTAQVPNELSYLQSVASTGILLEISVDGPKAHQQKFLWALIGHGVWGPPRPPVGSRGNVPVGGPRGAKPPWPKTILALLGASISLLLDMFVAIFSMLFIQNLH